MELGLSPAYGKKYSTPDEALAAYNADKDFRQHGLSGGTYANKADLLSPNANPGGSHHIDTVKIYLDGWYTDYVLATIEGKQLGV
jgi:hypothetical protein